MKAYLWKTGLKIRPFQDPVGDSLVINIQLRNHQNQVLSSYGFETHEIDDPSSIREREYLLIKDNLYFARTAFERFWRKVQATRASGACAMAKGPFTDFTACLQDLRVEQDPETDREVVIYGLYYINGENPDTELLDRLPPLVIEAEQKEFPIEAGSLMPRSVKIEFTPAHTEAILMHICHWVHIWLVNLMALASALTDAFLGSKFKLAIRALSAFSLNKHKMANRFVIKGKRCDIHPTAVVQGCILGDHVEIGPYAVVRGSILGSHVKIPEQAIVVGSILGDHTSTCNRGVAKLCVLYPGSSAGKMQGCLLGKDVFVADFALFFDVKLRGTVKVYHQGRYVDTGFGFLGGCVGHGSVIGSGSWIDSGREIPNKSTVLKNRDDIISKIPPDLPPGQLLTVRKSTLTRFQNVSDLGRPADSKGGNVSEHVQDER